MAIAILESNVLSAPKVLSELNESKKSKDKQMSHSVYILRTSSNTLYVGQTNNLERRLKEHHDKGSKTAKYIRYFRDFQLVYTKTFPTRIGAMRRELQLKRWSKAKKEALISGDLKLLKEL